MKQLTLKLFGNSVSNPNLIGIVNQELTNHRFIVADGRSLDINGQLTSPRDTNYWRCEILNLNTSNDESRLVELLSDIIDKTGIKIQYTLK